MFYFSPDRETATATISGLAVILLSVSMTFFPSNKIASFILRDILMILLQGFAFPLYFIRIKKRKSIAVLGIHKQKLGISLLINIIAAISLLAMFISKKTASISFDKNSFYAISYIFVAGIFEMIFIYGFLGYEFKRAFGTFPSILLTSIFYSLHHAGFQPEFTKLLFVGILYSSVFNITCNIFIIFPFFWGVGAVWDVLINSIAGQEIKNFDSFIISIILVVMMVIISFIINNEDARFIKNL